MSASSENSRSTVSKQLAVIEAIPESAPAIESVLSIPARQILLRDALDEVPEHYRDVVALWLEGRDNVEIASTLGINYNTVRSRLGRGKALFLAAYSAALDEDPR